MLPGELNRYYKPFNDIFSALYKYMTNCIAIISIIFPPVILREILKHSPRLTAMENS